MKAQTKVYLSVVISFLFLLFPLAISFDNITENNKMLKYLSDDQIKNGMGAEQLSFFEDIQQLAEDRLQAAVDKQEGQVTAAAQANDIAAQTLDAAVNKFTIAVGSMEATATKMASAADQPIKIDVNVVGNVLGSSQPEYLTELGLAP